MRKIKGQEVKLSDLEQQEETTKIGNLTFVVIKFYRVTKHSGMQIMYARVGEKFYGGMRYSESDDEDEVCSSIANLYMDGMLRDATDDIFVHTNLGRKLEELEKARLMCDCRMPELSSN